MIQPSSYVWDCEGPVRVGRKETGDQTRGDRGSTESNPIDREVLRRPTDWVQKTGKSA